MIPTIVAGVAYGLLAFAWLIVLLVNAFRLYKVVTVDDEGDRSDRRGWIVWGISFASLFTGCCVAIVAWVVMEWVLRPLDPFEDSVGTIWLFGMARTNASFVIITNILAIVIWGLVFGLQGAG